MIRLVILLILIIFIISAYSMNYQNNNDNNFLTHINSSLLNVESRRRKTGHYFIHSFHGWYALSWIYWIKVKLIIVAFFVGTTFIWAIQYLARYCRRYPSAGYIHHGYYRALEDPVIEKFLQSLN